MVPDSSQAVARMQFKGDKLSRSLHSKTAKIRPNFFGVSPILAKGLGLRVVGIKGESAQKDYSPRRVATNEMNHDALLFFDLVL